MVNPILLMENRFEHILTRNINFVVAYNFFSLGVKVFSFLNAEKTIGISATIDTHSVWQDPNCNLIAC